MKIKSILIANRGEIAIRIIRTAKKLGIRSYVIKTAKEPNAWYLEEADEVIDFSECFDDNTPEFLDIERIIYQAKQHEVDSIHPGYGFLAENPDLHEGAKRRRSYLSGPHTMPFTGWEIKPSPRNWQKRIMFRSWAGAKDLWLMLKKRGRFPTRLGTR